VTFGSLRICALAVRHAVLADVAQLVFVGVAAVAEPAAARAAMNAIKVGERFTERFSI
jgi:hypothetical protein